jgi:exonuclease VII small subunit
LESNKVTQNQLTTQGQSFEANLASLEAMVEQVFNGDQAMGKLKRVSKKGVRLW